MTFHTQLLWAQYHCVLGEIDEFIQIYDGMRHLLLFGGYFLIGLNIL